MTPNQPASDNGATTPSESISSGLGAPCPSRFVSRSMKTKLKIILVTFATTTVFWCLVVVGFFWFASEQSSGVSFIEDAHRRGFIVRMRAANAESQPVTFVVEELRTNATRATASPVVLLERELTPSGEFWVGIRKTKTEIRSP